MTLPLSPSSFSPGNRSVMYLTVSPGSLALSLPLVLSSSSAIRCSLSLLSFSGSYSASPAPPPLLSTASPNIVITSCSVVSNFVSCSSFLSSSSPSLSLSLLSSRSCSACSLVSSSTSLLRISVTNRWKASSSSTLALACVFRSTHRKAITCFLPSAEELCLGPACPSSSSF
eukprot:CAMPEP_0114141874 /NCGR_PEP_ID=MMETSP0043_2-20121206/18143_1 /TAXON_ID=464988 /ORGANISM="Hemiselmis andersenii, Strain CCMP644" /LENGTH=171 /DNA_ID=CAMNT_0001236049 /DNA_START=127 /DNA_END=642 /DNA_ORIENTATION=+